MECEDGQTSPLAEAQCLVSALAPEGRAMPVCDAAAAAAEGGGSEGEVRCMDLLVGRAPTHKPGEEWLSLDPTDMSNGLTDDQRVHIFRMWDPDKIRADSKAAHGCNHARRWVSRPGFDLFEFYESADCPFKPDGRWDEEAVDDLDRLVQALHYAWTRYYQCRAGREEMLAFLRDESRGGTRGAVWEHHAATTHWKWLALLLGERVKDLISASSLSLQTTRLSMCDLSDVPK